MSRKEIRITAGEGTNLDALGITTSVSGDPYKAIGSLACNMVDPSETAEIRVTFTGKYSVFEAFDDNGHLIRVIGPTITSVRNKDGSYESREIKESEWMKKN